jgi:hypothetical protein
MSDTPISTVPASSVDLNPPLASPAPSATESAVPGGGVDDTQAVIASLREHRSQLGAQSKPLDFTVPGYDDLLVVRCKWIPFKDLSDGAQGLKKISEPTALQIAAAADTLLSTCQELLIRVDDELRPLSKDAIPITFGDPRLPELLGFAPTSNAREAVCAVFANEYALITASNVIIEWLQDTTKKVNRAFLGN